MNTIEGVALSPQQRRLWLLQETFGARNAQGMVAIDGYLESGALRSALADAAARHDVCRTSFQRIPGMKVPLQVVRENARVVWAEHDWSELGDRRQEEEMARLSAAESQAAQVAGDSSALRAALVSRAPQRHVLLLTLPALCADARTLELLRNEIVAAYAGELRDEEKMQYWQYAGWLNEILAEEDAEQGRRYWRDLGSGRAKPPELPFAPRATSAGRIRHFPVGTGAFSALVREAAERLSISAESFLFAGWQSVLQRLTGEPDIELTGAFDGREFEELEEVCGPFTRLLPVPCRQLGDRPLAEIASTVDAVFEEHFEWQRFFEDSSRPPGDSPAALPFVFDSRAESESLHARGAVFAAVQHVEDPDFFALKLLMTEVGEQGLKVSLAYDAERYPEPEVSRLAGYLETLTRAAARRPEVPASELEMLDAGERARVIGLARAPSSSPAGNGLRAHELFEARAAENPSALALEIGESSWSYAELNARAESVARRLREFGGPEARIGLHLTASPEAVAAILGILKAGAAFVPVDPHGPVERTLFMLRDSGARAVVTRRGLAELLDGFEGERILADELTDGGETPPAARQPAPAESLAYVIYTSGSTGRPKGVAVEHRQLTHYLEFVDRELGGDRFDTFPLVSALTFDASLKQVFLPLMRGDALRGVTAGELPDPGDLFARLGGLRRTAFNCTPSFWRALLDEAERGNEAIPAALRTVFLGGEPLTEALLERSFAAIDGLEVWNLYGPTETTANAVVGRLVRGRRVRIGRPRPDLKAYVLDARLEVLPMGAPGELCIAGPAVARGYLGQSGLTAERFLPDPFASWPGERMYRTGDRVRQDADGEIEYLGRTDHQVKIRGFRIELGEIERRIVALSGVGDAVVLLCDEGTEQARLAACLSGETGAGLTPDSLRQMLREQLPEYMVPVSFLILNELPRLASGKIDRNALAAAVAAPESRPVVEPRNPREELFAGIWKEILERDEVGVLDNFFELGGHSIQSIRIVHRIREEGYDLSPRDLLQNPTIAELAVLSQSREAGLAEGGAEYEEGTL